MIKIRYELILDQADEQILNKNFIRIQIQKRIKGGKKNIHQIIADSLDWKVPKGCVIDHINGNELDNRVSNLQIITYAQNMQKSRLPATNTSGWRGVYWCKNAKKWRAQIKINNKTTHLGCFDDKIEAAKAYDDAAKKYYRDFAQLNFPNKPRQELIRPTVRNYKNKTIKIIYELILDDDFGWILRGNHVDVRAIMAYKGTMKTMHQIIVDRLGWNIPKGYVIDHINGNSMDNRRENLQIITYAQNMQKSRLFATNTSGWRGVYWRKATKKWGARININNKTIHLGYFDNKEVAAREYDKAARKYHGKFAQLNFPDDLQK